MESRRARKTARPAIHAMRRRDSPRETERAVVPMIYWTTDEEDVLKANAYRGAEAVSELLLAECGTRRSVRAVQQYASRIGVSLRVQEVCPQCGVVGLRLNKRSGLCQKCTNLMHLQEEIAFNELLLRERIEAVGSETFEEAVRLYNSKRQENARICQKFELSTRRERKRGSDGCICPACAHWPGCLGPICDTG